MRTATITSRPTTPLRTWGPVLLGLAAITVTGGVGIATATSPDDAATYLPINPCRLADTRPGTDNVGDRTTPLGPDEHLTLHGHGERGLCTGPAALPANATGLQLNVTAVNATQPTFLTLYPGGTDRPTASHLNPTPGAPPAPNAVAVKLAGDGTFNVFNRFGSVDVIIDVVGIYTDHHHDDRYYTRADIDANHYTRDEVDANYYTRDQIDTNHYTRAEVDALTEPVDEPWEVQVPARAFRINSDSDGADDAKFLHGSIEMWAMTQFQLPLTYEPGTDIAVEITFTINDSDCDFVLGGFPALAVRPDGSSVEVPLEYEFGTPTSSFLHRYEAPSTGAGQTRIVISGDELEPGTWIEFRPGRAGQDLEDTCTGHMKLFGLTVREA